MGANTKIFVFKAKELIYTGIFVLLGILFLLLLIFMLLPNREKAQTTESVMHYIPGIYSSSIHLGGSSVDVKVTITDEKVTSISLSGLNDTISAMYPLLEKTVNDLNIQLEKTDSLEELTFNSESQYTNTLIKQAVQNAVSKAKPD